MRKSVIIFGLAILVLTLLIAIYSRHDAPAPVAQTQPETAAVNNNFPPPKAVAKTDGYKLTIGVNNLQVNKKQVFLPPTNSVAITNEAQLQQLVKLSRSQRQKTNTQ